MPEKSRASSRHASRASSSKKRVEIVDREDVRLTPDEMARTGNSNVSLTPRHAVSVTPLKSALKLLSSFSDLELPLPPILALSRRESLYGYSRDELFSDEVELQPFEITCVHDALSTIALDRKYITIEDTMRHLRNYLFSGSGPQCEVESIKDVAISHALDLAAVRNPECHTELDARETSRKLENDFGYCLDGLHVSVNPSIGPLVSEYLLGIDTLYDDDHERLARLLIQIVQSSGADENLDVMYTFRAIFRCVILMLAANADDSNNDVGVSGANGVGAQDRKLMWGQALQRAHSIARVILLSCSIDNNGRMSMKDICEIYGLDSYVFSRGLRPEGENKGELTRRLELSDCSLLWGGLRRLSTSTSPPSLTRLQPVITATLGAEGVVSDTPSLDAICTAVLEFIDEHVNQVTPRCMEISPPTPISGDDEPVGSKEWAPVRIALCTLQSLLIKQPTAFISSIPIMPVEKRIEVAARKLFLFVSSEVLQPIVRCLLLLQARAVASNTRFLRRSAVYIALLASLEAVPRERAARIPVQSAVVGHSPPPSDEQYNVWARDYGSKYSFGSSQRSGKAFSDSVYDVNTSVISDDLRGLAILDQKLNSPSEETRSDTDDDESLKDNGSDNDTPLPQTDQSDNHCSSSSSSISPFNCISIPLSEDESEEIPRISGAVSITQVEEILKDALLAVPECEVETEGCTRTTDEVDISDLTRSLVDKCGGIPGTFLPDYVVTFDCPPPENAVGRSEAATSYEPEDNRIAEIDRPPASDTRGLSEEEITVLRDALEKLLRATRDIDVHPLLNGCVTKSKLRSVISTALPTRALNLVDRIVDSYLFCSTGKPICIPQFSKEFLEMVSAGSREEGGGLENLPPLDEGLETFYDISNAICFTSLSYCELRIHVSCFRPTHACNAVALRAMPYETVFKLARTFVAIAHEHAADPRRQRRANSEQQAEPSVHFLLNSTLLLEHSCLPYGQVPRNYIVPEDLRPFWTDRLSSGSQLDEDELNSTSRRVSDVTRIGNSTSDRRLQRIFDIYEPRGTGRLGFWEFLRSYCPGFQGSPILTDEQIETVLSNAAVFKTNS